MNDGGPVIPVAAGVEHEKRWHPGYGDWDEKIPVISGGLSIRDYFAGQALLGMLHEVSHPDGMKYQPCHKERARLAYEMADAMLAARKVQP